MFVVRQAVGYEGAEFMVELFGGGEAVADYDEGAGNFSSLEVGLGDDSAIADGGMFEQDGFDFGGGDGESLVFDHLLAAVEHVEEAVGVGADDVAGVVPAIAQNGVGGLRFFPVSQHELRATHDEFAGLAGCDLIVVDVEHATFGECEGLADGSGAVHLWRRDVANVGDGRGFRHAISLIDAGGEQAQLPASQPAVALTELEPGEAGTIDHISLPFLGQQFLMRVGFVPGVQVEFSRRAPLGDPSVYLVDGTEIALRSETAKSIMVRRAEIPQLGDLP